MKCYNDMPFSSGQSESRLEDVKAMLKRS